MLLSMDKVNLIYDIGKSTETYALKDINLNIRENKFYGLLGPSGSGKSSLLYLLSGLKSPSSGKVLYNGIDYTEMKSKVISELRMKDFGFIFQRHFLMDYLTTVQNVLVPINSSSSSDVNKAKELLSRFGLENDFHKKPYQLSGGQRQRVAIARALINEPKVIFADEITASLDHKNAFEVMTILKEYKTTLLVVTHDESILKDVDEIISLWDGAIQKTGHRAVEI